MTIRKYIIPLAVVLASGMGVAAYAADSNMSTQPMKHGPGNMSGSMGSHAMKDCAKGGKVTHKDMSQKMSDGHMKPSTDKASSMAGNGMSSSHMKKCTNSSNHMMNGKGM